MFIGICKNVKLSYTKFGGKVPLEPEITGEGAILFRWQRICNTGFEIHIKLDKEYYVGSVTIPFNPKSRVCSVKLMSKGKTVGVFNAGNGNVKSGSITVDAGVFTDKLTVRIESGIYDVWFDKPEVSVFDNDTPIIWPMPKKASIENGTVRISSISGEGSDASFAARFLDDLLTERFGNVKTENGVSVTVVTDESYKDERYTVSVTKDGITLTAGKRISLLYAVYALISLGNNGEFRRAEIDNYPTLEFRGFHMGLPKVSNIEFTKRLFRDVLLPLGYNTLFVQIFGSMEYERHPEITEAWRKQLQVDPNFPHHDLGSEGETISKKDVSDLLDYARELGFEIIPEVQSLGHVQWLTLPHPEIAEAVKHNVTVEDTRNEDNRPSEEYFHCYCPSNDDSYKLLFDVMDEILEVSKPQRYVHIGHDEVYNIGLCDKCKDTTHDVLFARDVKRIYDHLKELGYGTMMWSDMLQPCSDYQTPPARKVLPRDIVMLDFIWYFHLDKDIEENLYEEGYKVMAGNLYSSHYPRYNKRARNESFLGGEVSTWCAINEESLGSNGKLWDVMYSAEMLWNHERYDDSHRKAISYVISKYIQPIMRDLIRNKYSASGYVETEFELPEGESTLEGIPIPLLCACPFAKLADGMSVSVGGKYERFAIEHTALEKEMRPLRGGHVLSGEYTLTYFDGSEYKAKVEYGKHVMKYDTSYAQPYPEAFYRHFGYVGTWYCDPIFKGKTDDGADLLVMSYILENPYPEKAVESISYKAAEDDVTNIVLCAVKGMNKKV